MMGISRTIFGKFGEKLDLMKYMMFCGGLCLICYIAASTSQSPMIGLLGCVICGFSVGIMWPGTISVSSKRMPYGGTAMFALLAMAGDLGGAFGPSLAGMVTQACGDDLQKGMLAGSIFPLVLVACVLVLRRTNQKG